MRNTIAICLLLATLATKAQPNALNFINFSSNNGLSSNTVNDIFKDRLGYMWFATEDGLDRFDGTNFKVYNHNQLDTNSIATNQIRVLCEDSHGDLWVGTNRTLSLYDRQKDCFYNYNIAFGTAVRAICPDSAGYLWIGSYAGLIKYDPTRRQAIYYTADSSKPDRLRSNTITCLYRDSKDRLWVGSNAGLYLFHPGTGNFTRFCNDPADPASISDNVIKTIVEDRQGRLWIGTLDGGLNRLEADDSHFAHFRTNKTNVHSLSSNSVYTLVSEPGGNLWVGTEEGLDIFDPLSGVVQRVSPNDRNKYSLKGHAVRCLFVDRQGIYWVGTFQGGVNKYDRNLPFFNLVQYNPFDPAGLSCPKVTSFADAGYGNLYVGTDGGGLNLYDRKTALFRHIAISGDRNGPRLAILALERAGDQLWIGTFQRGVYVLDTRNNKVRHYVKGNNPGDLPSDDIFCLKKDRQGNVWLGSNGKGVCLYDQKLQRFRRFGPITIDGKNARILSDGFIRAIDQDSSGNMVIGTVGSGVALFDPLHNSCRVFNRANTGLPLDEAISLHIDAKGTIWAGTPSGGLCRLDCRNKKFTNYSAGLANNVIYKILQDATGNLWVSTNKGISCLAPQQLDFKNYSVHNGLQQSSFILGSGLKLSTGELFFGGIEGFNYFQPAALPDNRNIPVIVFTDLKIGGRSVAPGDRSPIKEHISIAREITVNYKQNFALDFTALDFTTPAENRYMYRLAGLDRAWNELGSSSTAAFTNLDPGSYTLEVRARNANGAWTTPAATIKIFVTPPFWLTGYAYAFYIFIAGLLLWGIRRRGIQKLKTRFTLEQERLKIKFLTNLSHEFRTPISLIVGPLEKLQEHEMDADKQRQLAMVKRNARRLLNLVNQLLDFRKLEAHELRLNANEGEFISFIKEVAESFMDIAERKQIRFTFHTALNHFYTAFDRDKIERVLFNLLGNAFKFTGKDGSITLEVKQPHPSKGLLIVVTDTGIGMTTAEQQHIFDRFFQGHGGVMNQGSGIGLSITREFVRLHGGSITVESEPAKGSIFTVCLPLEELPQPGYLTAPDAPARQTITNPPVSVDPPDGLSVLLVEDNDDFRCYLRDSLRHHYKIIEASDGREGWQKAVSGHPDIIVSDISMPNMDGIELSRKIRSDRRLNHVPVILLTALTEDAYQLKGLRTGASDYLTKPFSFEILDIKIRNLVNLNQQLRETYTRRLTIETPVTEVQSEDEKLILTVTHFIESNLDSANLSVEELSRHVFMSHTSLYRKLVDLTGETPVEFIRSVKLKKAVDLLEHSDMKISEIGYAVGFATPNYFTRAFKAKYNLSPSEYMKRKVAG